MKSARPFGTLVRLPSMGPNSAVPSVGEGMVHRHVVLRARDVVFFKGVLEASDGLAAIYGEHGGDLTVSTPVARQEELDAVLAALCTELDAVILP